MARLRIAHHFLGRDRASLPSGHVEGNAHIVQHALSQTFESSDHRRNTISDRLLPVSGASFMSTPASICVACWRGRGSGICAAPRCLARTSAMASRTRLAKMHVMRKKEQGAFLSSSIAGISAHSGSGAQSNSSRPGSGRSSLFRLAASTTQKHTKEDVQTPSRKC